LGLYTFTAITLAALAWKTAIVPFKVDRDLLRRILKLSIPMIGFTVSQYVFSSVDILILKIFRGQADVGIYAVAYQAFSTLTGIAQSVTIVLVPLFVSLKLAGREDIVKRYVQRHVEQGLFLVAVFAGLAIPFLPLIVPVMFGPAFASADTPMAVLMFALTFFFANYLIAPVLTLYEQTRAMAVIFTCGAALNVVGDVVLVAILHMGILAPAIATSAALASMYAGYYFAAGRVLQTARRLPIVSLTPLCAGLVPILVWRGVTGSLIGVSCVVLASVALIIWKRPFRQEDAAAIAVLRLPNFVKRYAIAVINFVD
jgi:O-antigen/teichoic acid export membrane protein